MSQQRDWNKTELARIEIAHMAIDSLESLEEVVAVLSALVPQQLDAISKISLSILKEKDRNLN